MVGKKLLKMLHISLICKDQPLIRHYKNSRINSEKFKEKENIQ